MKGFTNNGFLKMIDVKIINKNTNAPHKNPRVALPNKLDINQEKEMTKKSRKNNIMKLTIKMSNNKLIVLDKIRIDVSFNIFILVSTYSLTNFLLSW
jgi:predicted carbohydrate-binding protein with CBM5 and CBM33 domain